jgi:transposase-like protein
MAGAAGGGGGVTYSANSARDLYRLIRFTHNHNCANIFYMNMISGVSYIHKREDLAIPKSLPEFQRLFPDDAACAIYLERCRWANGFECPHCHERGEPFRFATRPGVLRCRKCRRDVALTAGTIMERTHTPLSTWFWGAYLVSSITPGISTIQFQRQLGLRRYETAFQILHKLRAGMVRANQDRIGSARPDIHVEVHETWIGGATRDERRRGDSKILVVVAVEVLRRKPKEGAAIPYQGGRYAGRLRLEVVPNRTAKTLCAFVEAAVEPRTKIVTDASPGYRTLRERGYKHLVVADGDKPELADDYMSMARLIFMNLKSWLSGTHHGVSPQHLQAYLNEFAFRFNHRLNPFNAFGSLLGLASRTDAPTYAELYSGESKHGTMTSHSA